MHFDNKTKNYYKYQVFHFEGSLERGNLVECEVSKRISYSTKAVFIGKGKLLSLTEEKEIKVADYENETIQKSISNIPSVDNIFAAPIGKVLIKSSDSLLLYDLTMKLFFFI